MKKTGRILFILYILFMVYFLLFSDWYGRTRSPEEYRYNLVLFTEIKRFWNGWKILGWESVFMNLAGNVLIFVPFGFLMSMARGKANAIAVTAFSVSFSFWVELFQLVTKLGSFDVDDLLLNTIGGVLGYIVFVLWRSGRRKHGKK